MRYPSSFLFYVMPYVERKPACRAVLVKPDGFSPARSSARTCLTAMAVVAGCSTVSCGVFDLCGESRNFDAMIEADFTATGAVDGLISMLDSRDDANDQFSWVVFFAPTDSADSLVTDIHLHEAETDDILYTFPVSVERADPNNPTLFAWIVSSFETSLYRGSVPFDLVYRLVSSNGTYVDVHTVAHPAGAKARVAVKQSTNWTEYCD